MISLCLGKYNDSQFYYNIYYFFYVNNYEVYILINHVETSGVRYFIRSALECGHVKLLKIKGYDFVTK